ncbi:MAG: UDP-N-acetylglucosamine--LPS N-acetylglucosamine transferase [Deltaproteobacteria bacterium]|nr:MAG: UDP-N-acetylglucosamine--LPS N-acetylglucosamine transferase [Deltaproteobacteria bacterium]
MRVGFVTSHGGHLGHLLWLRSWWEEHDRFWVASDRADVRDRLVGERVHYLPPARSRSLRQAAGQLARAPGILAAEQPDVLVSAGAGVAVPFFLAARTLGIPTVFIEVYDRIHTPTLTGRLVAPMATRVLVQWPEQQAFYPGSTLVGRIR